MMRSPLHIIGWQPCTARTRWHTSAWKFGTYPETSLLELYFACNARYLQSKRENVFDLRNHIRPLLESLLPLRPDSM